MLTGRLPFVSTNAMELVRMHRDDRAPSVADFRADAPTRLESLAAAALAKDPANRPADGGALLRELHGGVVGASSGDATVMFAPDPLPSTSDATQVLSPAKPPRRRRRALWAVPLAVALLGGGIALALLTTGGGDATPTTRPLPGLSLPTVPTAGSTKPATTAPATTEGTTTAPTSTAPTTTHRVTTVPVTPPPTVPTVLPTTTVAPLPTTTALPPPLPTTAPTTTDLAPTTSAAATTTTP